MLKHRTGKALSKSYEAVSLYMKVLGSEWHYYLRIQRLPECMNVGHTRHNNVALYAQAHRER